MNKHDLEQVGTNGQFPPLSAYSSQGVNTQTSFDFLQGIQLETGKNPAPSSLGPWDHFSKTYHETMGGKG